MTLNGVDSVKSVGSLLADKFMTRRPLNKTKVGPPEGTQRHLKSLNGVDSVESQWTDL